MQPLNSSQVLVYLQLYKNISLVFLDGWEDVTDHVCAVTKALSKRPFKYARAKTLPSRISSPVKPVVGFKRKVREKDKLEWLPSHIKHPSLQTPDRASRAAVLCGRFVGQRCSGGERRLRAA